MKHTLIIVVLAALLITGAAVFYGQKKIEIDEPTVCSSEIVRTTIGLHVAIDARIADNCNPITIYNLSADTWLIY